MYHRRTTCVMNIRTMVSILKRNAHFFCFISQKSNASEPPEQQLSGALLLLFLTPLLPQSNVRDALQKAFFA